MLEDKSYGVLIRVSSEMQANDGDSLDMQRSLADEYAKENGGEIYNYYMEEGLSASKTRIENRPMLLKLMDDIELGKVNHVIAYKRDRIMRNAEEMMWFLRKLGENNCGITLTARGESQIDMVGYQNSGASKIVEVVSATFAEMESAFISARVSDTLISKAKKGEFTGGIPTYGYKLENNKLIPIDSEIPVIQEIEDMYLKGYGLHSIVKWLNGYEIKDLGKRLVVPKKLKQHKNSSNLWTYETVKAILFNPTYSGYMKYVSKKNKDMEPIIVKSDIITPIRSEERQSKIDELRRKKEEKKQAPRKYNTPFLLSGVVKCGECGEDFVSVSTKHKNGGVYSYYACRTHSKKGHPSCGNRRYKKDTLEAFVIKEANTYMYRYVKDDAFEIIQSELKDNENEYESKISELDTQIIKAEKQFSEMMTLILELDKEDIAYEMLKSNYQNEQKNILISLNSLKASKEELLELKTHQKNKVVDIDKFIEASKRFPSIMKESSVPFKKQVIDELFEKITIDKNGYIEMKLTVKTPSIDEFISLPVAEQTSTGKDITNNTSSNTIQSNILVFGNEIIDSIKSNLFKYLNGIKDKSELYHIYVNGGLIPHSEYYRMKSGYSTPKLEKLREILKAVDRTVVDFMQSIRPDDYLECIPLLGECLDNKMQFVEEYGSIYKYSGKLICGNCGKGYYADSRGYSINYRCSSMKTPNGSCENRTIREKVLDSILESFKDNEKVVIYKNKIEILSDDEIIETIEK